MFSGRCAIVFHFLYFNGCGIHREGYKVYYTQFETTIGAAFVLTEND